MARQNPRMSSLSISKMCQHVILSCVRANTKQKAGLPEPGPRHGTLMVAAGLKTDLRPLRYASLCSSLLLYRQSLVERGTAMTKLRGFTTTLSSFTSALIRLTARCDSTHSATRRMQAAIFVGITTMNFDNTYVHHLRRRAWVLTLP